MNSYTEYMLLSNIFHHVFTNKSNKMYLLIFSLQTLFNFVKFPFLKEQTVNIWRYLTSKVGTNEQNHKSFLYFLTFYILVRVKWCCLGDILTTSYLLLKSTVLKRPSLQSLHQCQLQGNLSKIYQKTETFRHVPILYLSWFFLILIVSLLNW